MAFRKMWFMQLLEYRTDFIFWAVVSSLWTLFNFFFIEVLVSVTGNVAGWGRYEMYLLMSVFTLLDAIVWSFFYNIFRDYTRFIFTGGLDMLLTKPVDTQFLITVQRNSYTNVFRLLIGLGMLSWSLQKLQLTPSLSDGLMAFFLMMIGLLMIYSIWFIIATWAFYVERLDNINEIFPGLRQIFQMPRAIYTGVLSLLFTTLLPIALISSLPTEALLHRFDWRAIVYFCLTTVIFFILARKFFLISVRRYSSAGS